MRPSRCSARTRRSATGCCSSRPRPWARRCRISRRCAACRGCAVTVGEDRTVFLDGEAVGRAKTHALDGRPLAAVAPGVIPPGHYYLFADHADSHDSRYAEIGLVPRERILGRAVAMPDIPWLGLDGPLVGPEDSGAPAILPHPAEGPLPHDRDDPEAAR